MPLKSRGDLQTQCAPLRSFSVLRHPGPKSRAAVIARLDQLEELTIDNTGYSAMVAFKRMKALRRLTLRSCGAKEASDSLKQLTQLKLLRLDDCMIMNESFADLESILDEVGVKVVDISRVANGRSVTTSG